MTTLVLALAGVGLVVLGLVARARRRRTVYLPLERMSDAWRRAHAADPVPDHLR